VRDVVAPIKMVGAEIVRNIAAAIGLAPSPETACVLTDASRAIVSVFHDSMLHCFHCGLRAPPEQGRGSPETRSPA